RHLSFGYTHGSVYILRVFRFAEGAITLAEQHQCGPAIIGIKRLVCEQVGDTVSVYVGYSRQEAIRQRDWHSKVPGPIDSSQLVSKPHTVDPSAVEVSNQARPEQVGVVFEGRLPPNEGAITLTKKDLKSPRYPAVSGRKKNIGNTVPVEIGDKGSVG